MNKKIFNSSGKGRSSVILLFTFLIISLGAINCSKDSSPGGNNISATSTVETLTFSPVAGTYNTDQSVTIATATEGATIYYTTDGSAPTSSSTEYTAAISVAGYGTTMTIKAIAAKSGVTDSDVTEATYTIDYNATAMPTFSPAAGTYNADQSVTISTATEGALIYYTTDGSTPTNSSAEYTAAISVAGHGTTVTIKAIAVKSGVSDSNVAEALYTINYYAVAMPTFSPPAGTYNSAQTVTLSTTTAGASIKYTTDGSDPKTSGTVGTSVNVDQSMTVRAYAFNAGMIDSFESSAIYTLQALAPTFSPPARRVSSGTVVTISSSTAGANFYYTIDGSTPACSGTGTSGSTVTVSSVWTIRAVACLSGMTDSTVASASYTVPILYVTNSGSDTVTYLNATTGAVIDTYAVGASPRDVVVNPTANILYVANNGDDSVSYLNATTGANIGSSPYTVNRPNGIAINTSAFILYVTNYDDDTVSYLNATTGANIGSSPYTVGNGPGEVLVDTSASILYVINYIDATVSYLNATTGANIGSSPYDVGAAPRGLAVHTAFNILYVVNWGPDTVSYLNATTGAYINGTLSNSSFAVGYNPRRVAVSVGLGKLYVTNNGDGTVSYLNNYSGGLDGTYTVGTNPIGVAVNPTAQILYVANAGSDTVTYLNATTGAYINGTLSNSSFAVGTVPWGVAVWP